MKVTIEHTELITILENNLNINNAILEVAQKANYVDGEGISGRNTAELLDNMSDVLKAVLRSHELILQSLKSNTGIINQIRERVFPE